MSPVLVGTIGLVILIVLLFLRLWIGAGMALVGFLGIAYFNGWIAAFTVIGRVPFDNIAFYTISALPLLAGCFWRLGTALALLPNPIFTASRILPA